MLVDQHSEEQFRYKHYRCTIIC